MNNKSIISKREHNIHFEDLLINLTARPDNTSCLASRGGNATELLFFLTHRDSVICGKSCDDDFDIFDQFDSLNQYEIFLDFPIHVNWKQVREKVSQFINNHPDKKEISFQEIVDVKFLETINFPSNIIDIFNKAYRFVDSLDSKKEFYDAMSNMFEIELDLLKNSFKKEKMAQMKVTGISFEALSCKDQEYLTSESLILNRKSKMILNSFNQEDLSAIDLINQSNIEVRYLISRLIIGIEKMISLCLDESCINYKQ